MKPLIYVNPIRLLKTPYYFPLWKRHVVYPKYNAGDPHLKIPLVPYWMKIIHPGTHIAPDVVKFKVHPQMNNHEIKEYLRNIYKVDTMYVSTKMIYNDLESMYSDDNSKLKYYTYKMPYRVPPEPERYEKFASDQFTFPDLFSTKRPELELSGNTTDEKEENRPWFY